MINTAEEILNKHLTYGADTYDAGQRPNIIKAINEARKEAIKECMSLIKIEQVDPENEWVGQYGEYFKINREEIEALIDQIK